MAQAERSGLASTAIIYPHPPGLSPSITFTENAMRMNLLASLLLLAGTVLPGIASA